MKESLESLNFGIERFHRGFLDALTAVMITRFSQKPLHFIGKYSIERP